KETARPAKARATSALIPGLRRIPSGVAPGQALTFSGVTARTRSSERATKTARRNGLTSDNFVEARQFFLRLLLHGGPDGCSNFVHLMVESFRLENRFVELAQPGEVEHFERLDFENAIQESVLPSPRPMDAQVFALFLAAHHAELSERVVEVPGHELKLPGLRMEIDIVVLTRAQNAIHRGKPNRDGHEAREFLEVEIIAHLGGEFRIAGRRDQFAEIDYPLLLFGRQVRLGIVGLIVVLPIVTQGRKRVRCDRLEDRSLF